MEYVKCNLCGENDTAAMYSIEGFNIVKCRKCGLIYVNPRPGKESLRELYNGGYFSNNDKGVSEDYLGYSDYLANRANIEKTFSKRLARIERYVSPGRILDVGCALGFFLSAASSRGWDVRGIDLSEFAVNFARKEFDGRVENKTLSESALPSAGFDAVTYWDVLEHVPDPKSELREAHRVLKPGGIIGIVVPDAGSYAAKIFGKNWPEFKRIREHIYFFNKKTLPAMLASLGFEVLRIEGAGRIFNVPNLLAECEIYGKFMFGGLSKLAEKTWLSRVNIYVKPGYKFAVYARKK